jgi:hypothetical protein
VLAEVISVQDITGVEGTGSVDSVGSVILIEISGNAATGAVGIIFGFGWGAIPDSAETYTAIGDTAETYTTISNTAETYTPISDSAENWSVIADNSETWTPV